MNDPIVAVIVIVGLLCLLQLFDVDPKIKKAGVIVALVIVAVWLVRTYLS
jgi:hypothetical protein